MRVVAGIVAVLLMAPGVRAAGDAVSLRANLLSGVSVSKGCTSTSCPAGEVCASNPDTGMYHCTACNGAGANCLDSTLPCCSSCKQSTYTCA